jgi:hypothetical protein
MNTIPRPGAALAPLLASLSLALAATPSEAGKPAAGELHFSTHLSTTQNIRKAWYAYDGGTTLSVAEPTPIAKAPKSLGLVKAKDGDLPVTGGGANISYKVDIASGTVASQAGTWYIPRSIARVATLRCDTSAALPPFRRTGIGLFSERAKGQENDLPAQPFL